MNPDVLKLVLEGLIAVCTVLGVIYGVKAQVQVLEVKVNNLTEQHKTQGDEISEIKKDLRGVNQIVTANAVFDQRLLQMEQRVRELAHGEGFVGVEVVRRASRGPQ